MILDTVRVSTSESLKAQSFQNYFSLGSAGFFRELLLEVQNSTDTVIVNVIENPRNKTVKSLTGQRF